MRLFNLLGLPLAGVLVLCSTGAAQQKTPAEILGLAAKNGEQTLRALREFTYYAELTIETVSDAETITGKFYRFSVISYDANGNRQEKILENTSTLPPDVYIGTNAANNLTRVYQFIITPEILNRYELTYVGRERVDELNTYVFDVKPKVKLPDPDKSGERFLRGRVWLDDQDMAVVKISGEAVPEQNAHRTPRFETYFQNHNEYWFPAYTTADDDVRVGRRSTRVVVKVRFTSYKKAGSKK
jgi:hypothetical protein